MRSGMSPPARDSISALGKTRGDRPARDSRRARRNRANVIGEALQTAVKKNPLLPIFLIVLVDVLGLTIILPLLPFYAESFGASPQVVGYLVSTYAVCQLISGPLLGRLSDQTGRKPLLLISQAGTLVGFAMLAA